VKKAELVEALESSTGQTKAAINAILDALPTVVVTGLRHHGTVTLPGLVKIDARVRDARTVRNPQSGAAIEKPAAMAAALKPAKGLKDAVAAFPVA
jgi:nucleoid DNA-binding protein